MRIINLLVFLLDLIVIVGTGKHLLKLTFNWIILHLILIQKLAAKRLISRLDTILIQPNIISAPASSFSSKIKPVSAQISYPVQEHEARYAIDGNMSTYAEAEKLSDGLRSLLWLNVNLDAIYCIAQVGYLNLRINNNADTKDS